MFVCLCAYVINRYDESACVCARGTDSPPPAHRVVSLPSRFFNK